MGGTEPGRRSHRRGRRARRIWRIRRIRRRAEHRQPCRAHPAVSCPVCQLSDRRCATSRARAARACADASRRFTAAAGGPPTQPRLCIPTSHGAFAPTTAGPVDPAPAISAAPFASTDWSACAASSGSPVSLLIPLPSSAPARANAAGGADAASSMRAERIGQPHGASIQASALDVRDDLST